MTILDKIKNVTVFSDKYIPLVEYGNLIDKSCRMFVIGLWVTQLTAGNIITLCLMLKKLFV